MRTASIQLNELLFGQTKGRVLAFLYGDAHSRFYTRQLARQIYGSVGTVQRELTTLAAAGLLERSQSGNQVFYQANRSHPVFQELHSLLAKTAGVFHIVQTALEPFASGIEFAFVYGSFARGDETAGSDVDLMVIGDGALEDLLEQLAPVERTLQRSVNPTIYTRNELREKIRTGNHFLRAVQKGPLAFLMGNENELRAIR